MPSTSRNTPPLGDGRGPEPYMPPRWSFVLLVLIVLVVAAGLLTLALLAAGSM